METANSQGGLSATGMIRGMQLTNASMTSHKDLLSNNPSQLRNMDSPVKVIQMDDVIGEKSGKNARGMQPTSILLDKDERELLRHGDNVTQEQMWALLENKRFAKLQDSAVNLQGDMIFNKRCPKCTLIPPCRHYNDIEHMIQDAKSYLTSENFKSHLSPKKRQGLIMSVKEKQIDQRSQYGRSMMGDNQGQYLISDPSMQGLNVNSDLSRNFKKNLNTIQIDNVYDEQGPNTTNQSLSHLRKSSLPGIQIGGPRSLLQQNGQQIMGAQSSFDLKYPGLEKRVVKKQIGFMRKGSGRGGSPTQYDFGYVDNQTGQTMMMNQSQTSLSNMKQVGNIIPIRREQQQVRIRTKNNSYVYGNEDMMNNTQGSPGNYSSERHLWYKKRAKQEAIQKYKEFKLKMQIEQIEGQQVELQQKMQREKMMEQMRLKRNDRLKKEIYKYQEEKQIKEMEEKKQNDEQESKEMIRELRRQEYFKNQRKNIDEFRMQKERTENLLMIAGPGFVHRNQRLSNSQIKEYQKNIQQTLLSRRQDQMNEDDEQLNEMLNQQAEQDKFPNYQLPGNDGENETHEHTNTHSQNQNEQRQPASQRLEEEEESHSHTNSHSHTHSHDSDTEKDQGAAPQPDNNKKSNKSLAKTKSNATLSKQNEQLGFGSKTGGVDHTSSKALLPNAKTDSKSVKKDDKDTKQQEAPKAAETNAVGAKFNQTSEGDDERYTTENNQFEENQDEVSGNYTEYSSVQNKSAVDFNKKK